MEEIIGIDPDYYLNRFLVALEYFLEQYLIGIQRKNHTTYKPKNGKKKGFNEIGLAAVENEQVEKRDSVATHHACNTD